MILKDLQAVICGSYASLGVEISLIGRSGGCFNEDILFKNS
jgi:hypothetical protein